jgi:hypothetical protein
MGPDARLRRVLPWVGALLLLVLVPTGASSQSNVPGCAPKDGTTKVYGAGLQSCDVPDGVTQLKVEAWGSQGGDDHHGPLKHDNYGGSGGYAVNVIKVTPGTRLVIVGGYQGSDGKASQRGGAGGGGSSGVYTFYPPAALKDAVVVAGGGGGAGCDEGGFGGGIWGDRASGQGQPGFQSDNCDDQRAPGLGGIGDGTPGDGGQTGIKGTAGFGGSGGNTPSGGDGGWGGDSTGSGGPGHYSSQSGGAGGGGAGGGGGAWGAGGGGGGSYPASQGPGNKGNGRVAMTVPRVESLPCTIVGTPGNDVLLGTPGPDRICAGGGNDKIYGDEGPDVIVAGHGRDLCVGGTGHDRMRGCENSR